MDKFSSTHPCTHSGVRMKPSTCVHVTQSTQALDHPCTTQTVHTHTQQLSFPFLDITLLSEFSLPESIGGWGGDTEGSLWMKQFNTIPRQSDLI